MLLKTIKPRGLKKGDTIGFAAPCYMTDKPGCERAGKFLSSLGYKYKCAANIYSRATGFSGTIEERADDFNSLIRDPEVRCVLFGGGEVGNEILPYIDYDAIRRDPKLFCSYSDGTSLLDAIYYRAGIVTYYGSSIGALEAPTEYNLNAFKSRLADSNDLHFEKASEWRTIRGGSARGTLVGGYLVNFAVLANGKYFGFDKRKKYILFIEDHEGFSDESAVSKWFSHIEQSGLFDCVSGLIIGHYSLNDKPLFDKVLLRLGDSYDIPVVRCDDFGHGDNHGIIPIGIGAKLDADAGIFEFTEGSCAE